MAVRRAKSGNNLVRQVLLHSKSKASGKISRRRQQLLETFQSQSVSFMDVLLHSNVLNALRAVVVVVFKEEIAKLQAFHKPKLQEGKKKATICLPSIHVGLFHFPSSADGNTSCCFSVINVAAAWSFSTARAEGQN